MKVPNLGHEAEQKRSLSALGLSIFISHFVTTTDILQIASSFKTSKH